MAPALIAAVVWQVNCSKPSPPKRRRRAHRRLERTHRSPHQALRRRVSSTSVILGHRSSNFGYLRGQAPRADLRAVAASLQLRTRSSHFFTGLQRCRKARAQRSATAQVITSSAKTSHPKAARAKAPQLCIALADAVDIRSHIAERHKAAQGAASVRRRGSYPRSTGQH